MSNVNVQSFIRTWRQPIEDALKRHLVSPDAALDPHYGMMRYHMGWVDSNLEPKIRPAGKRLRPMLVMLVCHAMGCDPRLALPAAASVEILHNYSLLHDDIEDMDETRRHYPTVWKVWGNGQAVNAGDGMYACAFKAMLGLLEQGMEPAVVLGAVSMLTRTCVALTEGQFLDLRYEGIDYIALGSYFQMVKGKTASLFSTCLETGALLSGGTERCRQLFRQLGEEMGIAYQMLDDLAGIWGEEDETGKSPRTDITQRKKSFPIVTAMGAPDSGERMRALYAKDAGEDIGDLVMDTLDAADIRGICLRMLGQRVEKVEALLLELKGELGDQAPGLALLASYIQGMIRLPATTAQNA